MVIFHSYIKLPEGNYGDILMDMNGYYPLVSENVELIDHEKIGCIDRMKTYIADSATLNMMETLPKMLPFWARRKSQAPKHLSLVLMTSARDAWQKKLLEFGNWKITIFKFGKSTISMGHFQYLC